MRRQWIIVLSLGLNVVLAVAWLSHRRPAPPETIAKLEAAPATNPPSPRFIVRKQFFTWQELESPDYAAFVKNLRSINCPEQTVCDIVVADVDQQFAYSRLAEVVTPAQEWWASEPDTNLVAQSISQKQALEQRRREVLNTLLGTNWLNAAPPRIFQIFLTGPVLGDLSPETKHAVLGVLQRADHNLVLYANAIADQNAGTGTTGDASGAPTLDRQTRNELSLVLNPAQLEEYLLRYSDTAENLRRALPVEMTADEFRRIFRRADALEQRLLAESARSGSESFKRYHDLDAQLSAVIREVLGAERYGVYLYEKDALYRDAVDRVNEAGASPNAVQILYNLELASQNARNQIQNDPTLTEAQRQARLDALDIQEKQNTDQLLGLAPAPGVPAAIQPPPVQAAASSDYQIHPYSPGETVDQLAAQYGVSPVSIINANPDVNFNSLTRNQQIRIPKAQ